MNTFPQSSPSPNNNAPQLPSPQNLGVKRKKEEPEEEAPKRLRETPKVHILWDYEQVVLPYGVNAAALIGKLRKEAQSRGIIGSTSVVSGVGKVLAHNRQIFQVSSFHLRSFLRKNFSFFCSGHGI